MRPLSEAEARVLQVSQRAAALQLKVDAAKRRYVELVDEQRAATRSAAVAADELTPEQARRIHVLASLMERGRFDPAPFRTLPHWSSTIFDMVQNGEADVDRTTGELISSPGMFETYDQHDGYSDAEDEDGR